MYARRVNKRKKIGQSYELPHYSKIELTPQKVKFDGG